MLDYLLTIPHDIHLHFTTMTTLAWVALVFKVLFVILNYATSKYYEWKVYKLWRDVPGVSEEEAWKRAKAAINPRKKSNWRGWLKKLASISKFKAKL